MKPADKILTYQQARELRWFVKNCVGLRTEFYALLDKMNKFKNQLDRLDKTCQTIDDFFKDKCHHCGQAHEGIYQLSEWWCKKCLEVYGSTAGQTMMIENIERDDSGILK